MKKAAFAAVAVLAVVALSGSNLLSQAARESVTGRPNGGGFGNIRGGYEDASEEELLRSKLRKLVEMNSKAMSADELREAIGLIERFSVEPELAPIVEQLRAIEQEYFREQGADTTPEIGQVWLKAHLAIALIQTQDMKVLREVQETLENRRRALHKKPVMPRSRVEAELRERASQTGGERR